MKETQKTVLHSSLFLIRVVDLTALQRHYAVLYKYALDENDNLPETTDDTLPHEEVMNKYGQMHLIIPHHTLFEFVVPCLNTKLAAKLTSVGDLNNWETWEFRPSKVKAVQEFKNSVYGENYDEEMRLEAEEKAKGSVAAQKRKAAADVASKEANEYNWNELADSGKVTTLAARSLIW